MGKKKDTKIHESTNLAIRSLIAKTLSLGLELPVFVNRLDGPFEFLPQGLGEKLLHGHIKFLAEHDGETGINVVLLNVRFWNKLST